MEFKWSLDENMCVLFAIMSALNAKQQAMVTVSRKFGKSKKVKLFWVACLYVQYVTGVGQWSKRCQGCFQGS